MKIKIKRFEKDLPLPEYKTGGAAAMDVVARQTVTISPRQIGYVPLNIAIKLPPGYWALVAARSSLHKKGVLLANGIGVGDEDFSGSQDEYKAILLNFTDADVTIERGERIAQIMLMTKQTIEWEEVSELDETNRGGIGSTG
jgi:dUTP pyrophosphatase